MQLKLTLSKTVSISIEFEVLRSTRGEAPTSFLSDLIGVVELKVTVKTRFNTSKGDKKTSS